MAKKYKLIKDFPNCPLCTGSIVTYDNDKNEYYIIENLPYATKVESFKPSYVEYYPEFWEEVKELDYEILSFRNKQDINSGKAYSTLQKDGTYSCIDGLSGATAEWCLTQVNLEKYYIHSVKRLSDGEIFTVGDKITSDYENHCNDVHKISLIYLSSEGICFSCFDTSFVVSIRNTKHVKLPLFTTEDGVDIFEGDDLYWVHKKVLNFGKWNWKINKPELNNYQKSNWAYFSTKETAEKYIQENKPQYSEKDMLNFATFFKFGYSMNTEPKIAFKDWKLKNNK